MPDIQNLIKMLQSNNHYERYDACELLRRSPSLPPEALDALRLTINDENPDIADAARRAVEHHSRIEKLQLEQSQSQNWKSNLFLFGGLFFLMSFCGCYMFIFGSVSSWAVKDPYVPLLNLSSYSILFFPVGAIVVLIAAYIMHQKNYHAQANALIYFLIAVYLISLITFLIVVNI